MIKTNQKMKENIFSVEHILQLIKELIELLRLENCYLSEFKVSQINKLQLRKNSITEYLTNFQKQLKTNNDIKTQFSSKQTQVMKDLQILLDKEMKENVKLLTRAMNVNYKVLDCLKEVCLNQSRKIGGYNDSGDYGDKFKSSPEIPAFTLMNYI